MSDDAEVAVLMKDIRELAPTKRHRLAPDQVNGTRTHTLPAAKRILAYLSKCEDRKDREVPAVRPASPAPVKETIVPERNPEPARPQNQGRRPGPMVTEPGIYYYDDRVYKVIQSKYSGHFQARVHNPKTGKFTYVPGMMGILRPEDKMTPEQSIRYEELYGCPVCSDCGLPLENDLSRERRVGPKCWVKNNHH